MPHLSEKTMLTGYRKNKRKEKKGKEKKKGKNAKKPKINFLLCGSYLKLPNVVFWSDVPFLTKCV